MLLLLELEIMQRGDIQSKMSIIKKLSIIIFLLIIIFYIISFVNTNSVIYDFKNCVSKQIITNTALDAYIGCYNEEKGPVTSSKIEIHRRFVIHNFNKGIMYVKYSYKLYNKDGVIIGGAHNIPSTWFIEKNNEHWLVKKIKEKP